ncbi:MAG: hypothetical protein V4646_19270 [Pseudomonadota bacterium]
MKARNRGRSLARSWVLVLVMTGTAAFACGYCVEDRIAAVYDHALVQRTLATGHQMAYFAWDGPLTRDETARQKIRVLGEATRGVDKGSARVSMEPAAIAVAFDPRRSNPQTVWRALQQSLGSMKLAVIPLQAPAASAPTTLPKG